MQTSGIELLMYCMYLPPMDFTSIRSFVCHSPGSLKCQVKIPRNSQKVQKKKTIDWISVMTRKPHWER